MADKKKFLNIGQVLDGKDGSYINLNLESLKELVNLLQEFGAKNLKGIKPEDIRSKVKAKELPKFFVSIYDSHPNSPDFVLNDLVIKMDIND